MFNFLKKIFSEQKEEVGKEEIRVKGLEEWFDNKTDKIFSDLNVKIEEIRNKVKEEITKTKDNLAILGSANLHNPKISVREIQFMEGNRRAYMLGINNFLRLIDLNTDNYSSLLEFCENFNIKLGQFGKSTFRSYHILQEFFAHESRNIAINIKNLESLIKELRTVITDANIDEINEIKNIVADLNNKIEQKKEFEKTLEEKNNIKQGFMKSKEKVERELGELVKSQGYKELNELKANREVVLVGVKEHNARIVHVFSVLERSLKKLERVVVEESELLKKYIKNPVMALVSDNDLSIIGLLRKLEANINDYTLELKDKKREKVLGTIGELNEKFFKEFIRRYKELNDKLNNLEREIQSNETIKKEDTLNSELRKIKEELEKISNEIDFNRKESEKINIEEIKKSLEKEINGLLKTNITIS